MSAAAPATGDVAPTSMDRVIDVAFGGVLTALSLVALQPAFGGVAPLRIGVVGIVAAATAVGVAMRARLHGPLLVVGVAVAFLVFSGAAVPHVAPFGILPTPSALSSFLSGLVNGWKDSLTTAPPVGVEYGLGVVPYAAGFVGGLISLLLALRTEAALLPSIGPVVTLTVAIAFGEITAASVLICGVAVGAGCIAWGAIRAHRDHRELSGGTYWPRLVKAAVMIGFLGLAGSLLGQTLVGSTERNVLRRDVDPPFDPHRYPSPLAGIRNYLAKDEHGRHILTVDGLPKGASLRLATLDTYDGIVWAVGGPGAPSSGRFDRVGTSVTPAPSGEPGTVEVEVVDYSGIWVPTVGATESTRFLGDRAPEQIAAYRFNRTTGDGATPTGLAEGDRYRLEVRTKESDRKDAAPPSGDPLVDADVLRTLPPLPVVPDDLRDRALQMAEGETSDLRKALWIEEQFQGGFYSNGGKDARRHEKSAPGHSIFRLRAFLDPKIPRPIGDEEQYAAAMALVARLNNMPARVVMGFTVPDDQYHEGPLEIRGEHADAWVEIAFEGHGWVRFDPTPRREQTPKEQVEEKPEPQIAEVQPEPPYEYLQPPDLVANAATEGDDVAAEVPVAASGGGGVPALLLAAATYGAPPILVLAAAGSAIIGAKALRRRRRRRRGDTTDRLDGAWREAVDALRDLGVDARRQPTRLEFAASVPADSWPRGMTFATTVEHAMFAPTPPTDEAVERIWSQVDDQRVELTAPRTRVQRVRAALSLRSFRRWR